jgi:hypothetical protein
MWRRTDENKVHKPDCKFDVNMETGDKYVRDDDPPGFSVDADAMGQFVGAMFRHADKGSYVSLRAFPDQVEDRVPFAIVGLQVGDDVTELVPSAVELAQRCANAEQPIVFCPPIATFKGPNKATQAELVNGLALSVECDQGAQRARSDLEALLGPATAVVESGGEWADPKTGVLQPKLHIHWRLDTPTRTAEEHAKLRRARDLATDLVGGDGTNKAMVHPIRWPGSWHRKKAPRLSRVVAQTDNELSLDVALGLLENAVAATGATVKAKEDKCRPTE